MAGHYVTKTLLASNSHRHHPTMSIAEFLEELVSKLSKENYECTLSDYKFWMKIGTTHGCVSEDQLHNDILANLRSDSVYPTVKSGTLIHPTSRLLLQFVTDIEGESGSSTHARLCRTSLSDFFSDNLKIIRDPTFHGRDRFYTHVNFLAHWANLGYLSLEDVRDNILQSLTFKPTPDLHQLYSLFILLRIAGATFAAYVDPSVMENCFRVLEHPKSASHGEVRAFF